MISLADRFERPVIVSRIDLLQKQGRLFVRTATADGQYGLVEANEALRNSLSLYQNLVRPFFLGKDARELEMLIDKVYSEGRNYKYAGMPFWTCVAHIELSLFDLLGKLAAVPVHRLLGDQVRDQVPVYLTSFNRNSEPGVEVERMRQRLQETGARACKFKIGGRMGVVETHPDRTKTLVRAAREWLGDEVELFVDANGSYSIGEAIDIGAFLLEQGVSLFEEPCPWEERTLTRRVTAALDLTVAGGEQDSSLATIRDMIEQHTVDLIQPDVYYLGGIIRTLRVARMAAAAGMEIALHGPGGGAKNVPLLHLAAVVPNLWRYQEYPAADAIQDGRIEIPLAPGLSG